MGTFSSVNKIKIVFFSGTGGTARVADIFQKSLEAKGKLVIKHELNSRNKIINDSEDMFIINMPYMLVMPLNQFMNISMLFLKLIIS